MYRWIFSTPQQKTRQDGTHRPTNDMAHLRGTCFAHYYRNGMLIDAENDTDNRENRILLKIENIFYHFSNIHSRAQDKATHVATNTLITKASASGGVNEANAKWKEWEREKARERRINSIIPSSIRKLAILSLVFSVKNVGAINVMRTP